MQNKQLCSFHSCIVRFEFSFGVLLSFSFRDFQHLIVPEMKTNVLIWWDLVRRHVARPLCWRSTNPRVSRDLFCISGPLHTTVSLPKSGWKWYSWKLLVVKMVDNDSGSKSLPIKVEVDRRVMHQGCFYHFWGEFKFQSYMANPCTKQSFKLLSVE